LPGHPESDQTTQYKRVLSDLGPSIPFDFASRCVFECFIVLHLASRR
jgi:hypothetical protein